MIFMKLCLNFRDLDLVERFNISKFIVFNIFNIYVVVFYEILFEGVMKIVGIFF